MTTAACGCNGCVGAPVCDGDMACPGCISGQHGMERRHAHLRRVTPGDLSGVVVMNPESVGDLTETPRVFVGNDLRALFRPCRCGGVNGYHSEGCPDA